MSDTPTKRLPHAAIDFPDEHDPAFAGAFRELLIHARRAAQVDNTNNVTLKDGIEALRADGATEMEVNEYALTRSLFVMQQIAAGSGINIVLVDCYGKDVVQ